MAAVAFLQNSGLRRSCLILYVLPERPQVRSPLGAIVFVWFSDDCWLPVVKLFPVVILVVIPVVIPVAILVVILVLVVLVVIIFIIGVLRRHYIADEV
jgi:hypothetical protein